MKNLMLIIAFLSFTVSSSFAISTPINTVTIECEDGKKCDKKDCKHSKKECTKDCKKACCSKDAKAKATTKKACCASKKGGKSCSKAKAANKTEKK